MSADNWSDCPQCIKLYKEGIVADKETLVEAYGKVGANEFITMKTDLDNKVRGSYKTDTLREDYQLWIDENGEFIVNYRASCSDCGFEYEYNRCEQAL